MRKKLVLIGSGSVIFTRALTSDLIIDSLKRKWSLSLVDVDEKALNVAVGLCKKMISYKKADIEISWSTDRCDELPGADYVVTVIGVGGRRAWEQDVFIPRKYGIYQPIGDTTMPGGISRAARMIPAMLDIASDVKRLCPHAMFFNYSNPMSSICRAVNKTSDSSLVGLCHGVNDIEGFLASFAGLNRSKVTSYAVGLNHLTFFTDFLYEGKNAFPVVKEKLAERERAIACGNFGVEGIDYELEDLECLSWEFFKSYGVYPAAGERHVVEFFPERFPSGYYCGKTLGVDVDSFESCIKDGDEAYGEMEYLSKSPDPLTDMHFKKFGGEHEQLIDIINSIEYDKRRIFSVNMPNRGAVTNLPVDAVLELPAAATSRGLLPLQIGVLPDVLAAILAKHTSVIEITVEAALTGDKKLMTEAILMGGYISDREIVNKMVDELIFAHKKYLPQF
jgi:alpha-galactosidase